MTREARTGDVALILGIPARSPGSYYNNTFCMVLSDPLVREHPFAPGVKFNDIKTQDDQWGICATMYLIPVLDPDQDTGVTTQDSEGRGIPHEYLHQYNY